MEIIATLLLSAAAPEIAARAEATATARIVAAERIVFDASDLETETGLIRLTREPGDGAEQADRLYLVEFQ